VVVVQAGANEVAGADTDGAGGARRPGRGVIPAGVEVFVGLEPIDLRWGFDRLAGLVSERLGRDARSRALFVFFGKRHRRAVVPSSPPVRDGRRRPHPTIERPVS